MDYVYNFLQPLKDTSVLTKTIIFGDHTTQQVHTVDTFFNSLFVSL